MCYDEDSDMVRKESVAMKVDPQSVDEVCTIETAQVVARREGMGRDIEQSNRLRAILLV